MHSKDVGGFSLQAVVVDECAWAPTWQFTVSASLFRPIQLRPFRAVSIVFGAQVLEAGC